MMTAENQQTLPSADTSIVKEKFEVAMF